MKLSETNSPLLPLVLSASTISAILLFIDFLEWSAPSNTELRFHAFTAVSVLAEYAFYLKQKDKPCK